jgi:CheY-like chemotaxis protein
MTVATLGQKTVLVIEDEETIRTLITEELQNLGYSVIGVAEGAAGLTVLQSDIRVDLLLTDVGLPGGLNGRQVADAGRVTRPALKVLFITGYAENAAVGNGLLDHGMEVVTKPFEIAALAEKVRDMIER